MTILRIAFILYLLLEALRILREPSAVRVSSPCK
jgi:hypothetical protein